MYNLIRLIIGLLILFPLIWWVIKKWRKKENRKLALSLGVAGVFGMCLIFSIIGPIENLFYRWETPEEVFRYMFIDKTIVETIEYGNEAYVYYFTTWDYSKKGGQFLTRDEKGWLVSNPGITNYQYKSIPFLSEEIIGGITVKKPYNSDVSILTVTTIEMENGKVGSRPEVKDTTKEKFVVHETENAGVKRRVLFKQIKIDESYSLEIGEYIIPASYLMDFSIQQQTIELNKS